MKNGYCSIAWFVISSSGGNKVAVIAII